MAATLSRQRGFPDFTLSQHLTGHQRILAHTHLDGDRLDADWSALKLRIACNVIEIPDASYSI